MMPFMIPTKGSRKPKSVVSVMIGPAAILSSGLTIGPTGRERLVEERARRSPSGAGSTVSVYDEIRDQRQRFLVFGVLERLQRFLGGLRILMRSLERILDASMLDDQRSDLLDLVR